MAEKILDWFFNENCFSWFAGNGFTFVFFAGLISAALFCALSKKIRSFFF